MGSPVHAGIDLNGEYAGFLHKGFPRTRGDRPAPVLGPAMGQQVPPYTRG